MCVCAKGGEDTAGCLPSNDYVAMRKGGVGCSALHLMNRPQACSKCDDVCIRRQHGRHGVTATWRSKSSYAGCAYTHRGPVGVF